MKKLLSALALLFCAAWLVTAAGMGDLVKSKVLKNKLQVMVVENHQLPLVTICIAFRGGAMAQEPDTAGLFHLYEHMLFSGNKKYKTQQEFLAALGNLGTTEWNGSTGSEYINYYITIPSDELEAGIEFWSWAIMEPIFNDEKLAREKEVVLNENRGYFADNDNVAVNAIQSRMFSDLPWRKNTEGPESNIKAATVAQLEDMQAKYYIPANAALIVAGDVKPELVFALAEKHFGTWQGDTAPVIGSPPHGPISKNVNLIAPEDTYFDTLSQVQLRWRGPDVDRQPKDTYIADVLVFLVNSPVGKFKSSLSKLYPKIYDPEYTFFAYPTARDGGQFIFLTFLSLDENDTDIVKSAQELAVAVDIQCEQISRSPSTYFGKDALDQAKTKLIDANLLMAEDPSQFATGVLCFWWGVADSNYFFNYEDNCKKVSFADIAALAKKYLFGQESARLIRIKSSIRDGYSEELGNEKDAGYTVVSQANAYWWQE